MDRININETKFDPEKMRDHLEEVEQHVSEGRDKRAIEDLLWIVASLINHIEELSDN